MKKEIIKTEIKVKDNLIGIMRVGNVDYISLTDLAKSKNDKNPANVIIHWLSNKDTALYVGLWEELNNENFNFTEYREINEIAKKQFDVLQYTSGIRKIESLDIKTIQKSKKFPKI